MESSFAHRSGGISSSAEIHPTAVVSSLARIGHHVRIGPFCVIEGGTWIGDGCRLEARVVIKEGTILGVENHIFEGAVIGGLPQHINMPEKPGQVIIGSGNTIRENVTIHRALEEDEATVVGDNNLLMVNVHIAHDCRVGNNTIFANNVMLAGHVTVADRAYLSGAVAVHQFCRIGAYAMVGGQAHINKDVPPYVTVDGLSSYVVGLNQIGLRRAGFSSAEIRILKEAYRIIYRSGLSWNEVLRALRERYPEGPAAQFYPFLSTTTRGIVPERRSLNGAIFRLRRAEEEDNPLPELPVVNRVAQAG